MVTLNALAFGAHGVAPIRTHLILSGITFAASPGALFDVYLEDSADPKRREYAGTINFFGDLPEGGAHGVHERGENSEAAQGSTREFDVTNALQRLGDNKSEMNAVTVSFDATSGRVGSVETPKINADSRLTVNRIDFQISAVR